MVEGHGRQEESVLQCQGLRRALAVRRVGLEDLDQLQAVAVAQVLVQLVKQVRDVSANTRETGA